MMNTMKMFLKQVVTKHGGSMVVGRGATSKEALAEPMMSNIRHFAGGSQGQGKFTFKGRGTKGKVLVTEDIGARFTECITRSGADNKGAESGNKIWFITNAVDKDSFASRYHLGNEYLIDARSAAGKNGLTELYGVDPTMMAVHPILGKMKFVRIYIIHPRYTNWVNLYEKEKAEAAGEVKVKVKTLAQEEEEQTKTNVIDLNEKYLEQVMQNATKMIDSDSRIILLHPTNPPYSTWDLKKIEKNCGLKLDLTTVFDKLDFPDFSPRRAGTDLKLEIKEAMFYSYRLLTAEEKEKLALAEEKKQKAKGKAKKSKAKKGKNK